MGLQIEDGQGRGFVAGVTDDNQLKVFASSVNVEHYVNRILGRAFTMSVETSGSVNDACVLYMKNTSSEYDLIIEGLWIYTSDACEVYTKLNDTGTPSSTTTITPHNLNTRSGIIADGDFYKGSNIGGLSGGDEIFRLKFQGETDTSGFNYDQDVVLGQSGVHTIYCDTASVNLIIAVPFNFQKRVF